MDAYIHTCIVKLQLISAKFNYTWFIRFTWFAQFALFLALCFHNCFTAPADNNLNPLFSINNYCNSSKTKHTHSLADHLCYPLLLLHGPPLCLHQLKAGPVRPISHRRQSDISGPELRRAMPMPMPSCRCRYYCHCHCRIAELFIFIKKPPDSETDGEKFIAKCSKMVHIKKTKKQLHGKLNGNERV